MQPSAHIVGARPTRLRAGLGAAVVLVLVGLAIAIAASAIGSPRVSRSAAQPVSTATPPPGVVENPDRADSTGSIVTIYVHVFGAIARPGLYLLKDGDRIVDLISSAGGFTATADQSKVNLARLLVDGEQVGVSNLGEAAVLGEGSKAGSGGIGPGAEATGSKINVNTADSTSLETLPGVGPATAKLIIDWRSKNGRFTAIEDLLSVSGIGVKTLEHLRGLITV